MEDFVLGLLGCCVLLILPAAGGYVLVRLNGRLSDFELRLAALEKALNQLRSAPAAPEPRAVEVSPAPPPVSPEPPAPVEAPAVEPPRFEPKLTPPPVRVVEKEPPEPGGATPGLEEKLIGRLPVWLGAAAVVLAAAYLVKLSIDEGILTPRVRVVLGVVMGLGLLGAGEYLRQRSRYVSQGLSAAGVAALFIALFAAVNLYHLLPDAVGFVLMALVTAVAVVLSLRQGVIVATIGLVGGFVTPALVSGEEPRPGVLFSYLLLLQVGLVAVTRQRRWWVLAGCTLGASFIWAVVWLSGPFRPQDSAWVGFFLLTSAVIYTGSLAFGREDGGWGNLLAARLLGWAAMGGALVLTSTLARTARFGTLEWLYLGLLSAGCYVLARLRETFHGLAWLSAALVSFMLAFWADRLDVSETPAFFVTLSLFFVLFAGGAYAAHHGSRFAARWAALATTVGLFYFLLAEHFGSAVGLEWRWGLIGLALALLYAAAAWPLVGRRDPDARQPLAALLVGVTTLVSLAVVFELEHHWLTVAWALEIPALMWIAGRLDVAALRKMAGALTAFVGFRLMVVLLIADVPVGQTVIFNWLLLGYGVPCLAMVVSSVMARRQGSANLADVFTGVGLVFFWTLVTLEIRQAFHRSDLLEGSFSLAEWGTYAVAWFLLVLGSLAASERLGERVLDHGARWLFGSSVAVGGLALGLGVNPLLTHRAVGATPIVNLLLYAYGIPAALMVVLSVVFARRGIAHLARLSALAGLATVFLLVTLEVRQAFHGGFLDSGNVSNAENYTYSFAWIVLGTVLMVAGVARGSKVLRYAGLAVMGPAIFKVFLYDTRQLEGFLRVLSLLGLGASLFLLAFLYQRFVRQKSSGP